MAIVATRLALATGASWAPGKGVAEVLLGPRALTPGVYPSLLGLAIHLGVSVAWATAFALVAGTRLRGVGALAAGLAASVVIMFVMTFVVVPPLSPFLYERALATMPSWTAAHLAYGVGLALAPALRRRFGRRAPATEGMREPFARRADVR